VLSVLSKGHSRSADGRRSEKYPRYVDSAKTYPRGPVPAWLREKTIAPGYDPADRAQREEFKAPRPELAA
jgi:hypothetical protein